MSCSTAPLTAQQWLQFEEMYGVTLLQMYGMSETGWVGGNRHYAKKNGHRTVGLPACIRIADRRCGRQRMPAGRRRRDHSGRGRRWRSATCSTTARSIRCWASASRPRPRHQGRRGIRARLRPQQGSHHPRRRQHRARSKSTRCCSSIQASPRPAAVGLPDKINGEEVVCYVVPKDRALTEAAVLAHCGKFLPAAKYAEAGPDRARTAPKSDRGKVLRDQTPRGLAGAAQGHSVVLKVIPPPAQM